MTDEDKSNEPTEETEVKETPPQDAGKEKAPEKISLTQKELDGKLADARRKAEQAQKDAQKKYDDLVASIEAKEQAANDAAAEKVETLRKDLPEAIIELLDKMTNVEQLDWLTKNGNAINVKKEIPKLPEGRTEGGPQRRTLNIV